mgnify:CR=1 FL=1
MHTTDPSKLWHLRQDFESATGEALSRIIGGAVSDRSWEQAKLPVSMGGPGLRAAEERLPVLAMEKRTPCPKAPVGAAIGAGVGRGSLGVLDANWSSTCRVRSLRAVVTRMPSHVTQGKRTKVDAANQR